MDWGASPLHFTSEKKGKNKMDKEEIDGSDAEISCKVKGDTSISNINGNGIGILTALAILVIRFSNLTGKTIPYVLSTLADVVEDTKLDDGAGIGENKLG